MGRVGVARTLSMVAFASMAFGCSSGDSSPSHVDFGDTAIATDSSASDVSSGDVKDASAEATSEASSDGADTAVAIDSATSETSPPDAAIIDTGPDLGPAIDAPRSDGKPAPDKICETELSWWAIDASFDTAVTPSGFSSVVNPMLSPSSEHPIAIGDFYDDATSTWFFRASATTTGGDFKQHYPVDHPGENTEMVRTTSSFSSKTPESSAWVLIHDASSSPVTPVYVELVEANVAADYGDLLCQSLAHGTIDAVVPTRAGATTIVTKSGATTLAALLGAETSTTPTGWKVRLNFDGAKIEVTFK